MSQPDEFLNDEESEELLPIPGIGHAVERTVQLKTAGMRLDHFLLSPDLAARLIDAGISKAARAEEGASDHAPTWIELKPMARRAATPPTAVRPGRRRPSSSVR